MPKIKAATLQEHRETQRRTLILAARQIVQADGPFALSFEELARRAKLARPSIYEYFKSKGDLVLALIKEEFPAWSAELSQALTQASTPFEAVEAFVRDQLTWITEGRHEVAFRLMDYPLDEAQSNQARELHSDVSRVLIERLTEAGIQQPYLAASFISGTLATAAQSVGRADNPRQLIEEAVAFICAGVRALSAAAAHRASG